MSAGGPFALEDERARVFVREDVATAITSTVDQSDVVKAEMKQEALDRQIESSRTTSEQALRG